MYEEIRVPESVYWYLLSLETAPWVVPQTMGPWARATIAVGALEISRAAMGR